MSFSRCVRVSLVAVLISPLFAVTLFAQINPHEVLDEMIDTLGGEAYLGVSDITAIGRYYRFQRGQLAEVDVFRDYIKFPDRERTEFGDDQELIRINNGDVGWNIIDGTVEAQIGEQVALFWEEYKVSLDHLLRVVLPEGLATVQFVGRDMLDFARVDILEIRDEDRTRISLYIDRSSRLLLKKSLRRLDDPQVHEEVYSNYHDVEGVFTPLLVSRYTDGVKTMEIRFEEVRYNTDLPDDLFVAEVD